MEHFVGIDVSLDQSSLCVVDATGKIVLEIKVSSEPEPLNACLRRCGLTISRVGLEAGPLSQWLHRGLIGEGFEVVLLETRHVKAALSAMTNKTDRNDARGIAQLLRMGWFRPVHAKSPPAQEVRALLTGRKLLQTKRVDVELSIRGILRGFGIKVGVISKGRYEARIEELIAGHHTLRQVIEPMLRARRALQAEYHQLHRQVLAMVRANPVCRRLMSVPGVGALVAATYASAVDDPSRFRSSKALGAHFGLTPRKYQSGEKDITGSITKVGDGMVRSALYEAAHIILHRSAGASTLKGWAQDVARRRGAKRAKVALARKLATVLHRIWVDGSLFQPGEAPMAA